MIAVKGVLFNDRDGHTVLSERERGGLKLSHIANMKELDAAEQLNIGKGLIWLQGINEDNYISEAFFLKVHRKLFGEVWKWAGQYRSSEKNIGVEAWRVPVEMKKFFEDVTYWLENDSFSDWAELLAHFHHRLVYIHPFPNGNGRFSRIITNYLCLKNNRAEPSWHRFEDPTSRRQRYIQALREADQKKYESLIEFFNEQK